MENHFETLAARLLSREGIAVIWRLHMRAAAAFRQGNWLSATGLVRIADAAERLIRRRKRGAGFGFAAARARAGGGEAANRSSA
jgi:hypothetical protein